LIGKHLIQKTLFEPIYIEKLNIYFSPVVFFFLTFISTVVAFLSLHDTLFANSAYDFPHS